jgi:DNA-binding NarL/FixJ family response regulator
MKRASRRRAPPDAIRVVIADDHELIRISLTAVLAAAGMDVVGSYADGAETVAAVERMRPDVVVMDLSMPGMGGVEATRRILSIAPSTQIVALTGLASGPETDAALAAGAKALVFKDDGAEGVIAAIQGLPP